MGVKFSQIAIDPKSATDGVWHDLGAFKVKLSFAGLTNKDFQRKLEELSKPHRKAIDLGMFPAEQALALVKRAYAEVIVRDWDGFQNEDGSKMPYSVDACLELFEINPKAFQAVKELSEDDAGYRAASLELAGGNSPTASATA